MMMVEVFRDLSWRQRIISLFGLVCLSVLVAYVWTNKQLISINRVQAHNSLFRRNLSSISRSTVLEKGFMYSHSIMETQKSTELDRYVSNKTGLVSDLGKQANSSRYRQYPHLRSVSASTNYLLSKIPSNPAIAWHQLLLDHEKTRMLSFESEKPKSHNTAVNSSETIPNVVHYIWFGNQRRFTFINYLSFISVHKFLKSDYIFLHGDGVPADGYWWNRTKEQVANLYFVNTTRPMKAPNGQNLQFIEHSADLVRIFTLLDYGGIYLDTDVLILKSFDPLRQYRYVMGRVLPTDINNGIILSRRGEPFLSIWLEAYSAYIGPGESYTEKCTIVPHKLSQLFPHLIHVEEDSLNKPTWLQDGMRQLYLEQYDWSNNYAVHVWHRYLPQGAKVPQNPLDVQNLNSTIGEIVRYIINT